MSLIQMSLLGGVLILFIVVVRALALHHLPKAAFLVLWEVAALRLLLPFSIRLPFDTPAPVKNLTAAGNHLSASAAPASSVDTALSSAVPASVGSSTHMIFLLIWLAGFVLMAAYFLMCHVCVRRRFKASRPDNTPAVRSWLLSRKLRRTLEVRQSDKVSSPLTYGILHPVILLPSEMDRDNETTLSYILTHEFVHIRRFDAVTKLVFAAVLCVHWFNPLVWVMYVLANRDLELSCDECVMATLGGRKKAHYALTLIDMAEAQSGQPSVCNHFSKLAIEERIEAIMKYKKTSVLAVTLAVVLILGATTAFAISAQTDSTPAPSGQDSTLRGYIESDNTLMSYFNPDDGKTYYSFDDGKTFEPLTDAEFDRRFPTPKVEWWTYDEYAAWLENEKVELQAMLGETGWTGGRGEFVWTQEIIDETIAMYENILQQIKNGVLVSKSVDGDEDTFLMSNSESFASFKEDGPPAVAESDELEAAALLPGTGYGAVVDKVYALTYSAPTSNVIYFDSDAEREEHFRALDANEEKGLDRYSGFEAMYAGIDTNAPVIYVVKQSATI